MVQKHFHVAVGRAQHVDLVVFSDLPGLFDQLQKVVIAGALIFFLQLRKDAVDLLGLEQADDVVRPPLCLGFNTLMDFA